MNMIFLKKVFGKYILYLVCNDGDLVALAYGKNKEEVIEKIKNKQILPRPIKLYIEDEFLNEIDSKFIKVEDSILFDMDSGKRVGKIEIIMLGFSRNGICYLDVTSMIELKKALINDVIQNESDFYIFSDINKNMYYECEEVLSQLGYEIYNIRSTERLNFKLDFLSKEDSKIAIFVENNIIENVLERIFLEKEKSNIGNNKKIKIILDYKLLDEMDYKNLKANNMVIENEEDLNHIKN